MTEGELKKRLQDDVFKSTWHSVNMTHLKDAVLFDSVEKVVEEMKADFPDIWYGMKVKEIREKMSQVVDWKWKWLGEKESTK